nr:PREDICTED: facilitated trehalose transporter Tret1-like [Bemisia tabaci]
MHNQAEPSTSLDVPEQNVKDHFQYANATKSAWAQILASIMQNWLFIEIGLELVMPTVILGSLHNNPAEPLNMNDDQASWFGSIPAFCHPIGSLMSGLLQDKFGRKGAMMLVNIPIFMGWMILYFAESIHALYIVSVIMGLCTGLAEAPLHAYIGEIGEPRMRGTISTISTSCCSIGVWLMFLFGYLFDWRTVALVSSSCSIITFTFMTQLPESPTWLTLRGRLDEAKKSLCWLRGWVSSAEVEPEFLSLVKYTVKSARLSQENSAYSSLPIKEGEPVAKRGGFLKEQLKELTNKRTFRPLRLMFIVFIITDIAWVHGIKPYFVKELRMLESPIDPNLALRT